MSPMPRCSLDPGLYPGYRLGHFLGRGGFGEVWAARRTDGRKVALKFLPCVNNQEAISELRSLQLLRNLSHPNLLGISKLWSAGNFLVMEMELADGSLLDLLDACLAETGRPLPAADACPLLAQAADALDFLNARQHPYQGQRVGIQHGDVTPSNLLLFGERTVKLGDFSLSTPLSTAHKAHRRAGTPAYAAPEVFRGRLSDRSDQYALAVTYCLLRGGRLPFPDSPARLNRDYVRPAPDLGMLRPAEVPVVTRALAPTPEGRWPSCRAFMEELSKRAIPPRRASCGSGS